MIYNLNYQEFNLHSEEFNKIVYSSNYDSLLYEVYKKSPDIDKELRYIFRYYKNNKLPLFYLLDGIRIYAKSIRMTNIVENLQYNNGDIGTHYYQMKHYHMLIYTYDIKHKVNIICEIGFQLGVGAITLITSVKHNITYYGFDFGKNYSKNSYKIVSKYFNMKMVWGDSQITIPSFYENNNSFEKCDIIHIDACHSQKYIYNDIRNIKRLSKSKSLLLLDDVYYDSKAISEAIKEKLIANVKCLKWKPYCIAIFP